MQAEIGRHIPGRAGKQCRERYINHLDPELKRHDWLPSEDDALLSECETTSAASEP